MNVKIVKLREDAKLPVYSSEEAAGADLYACESLTIQPHETKVVHHGIAMELPKGTVGLLFGRSGLALKSDLAPANKVGVIDSDYRGELMTALHNHGTQVRTVNPGDRVAQLVIVPVLHAEFEQTESLSDTGRGAGGYGSTGK